MSEIVSEVSSRPSIGSSPSAARPVISQSVAIGGALSNLPPARERGGSAREAEERSNGGTIEHEVRAGGARVLSEGARKLLEVMDRPAAEAPAPVAEEPKTGAAAASPPAAASPAAQPAATTPPATPPAETPAQPTAAPHAAELERMLAKNRELVEENTRLKTGSSRRELTPREKALDEIERGYLENPRAAIRRLAALALGHEDTKHADVDAEVKGLLQDLTADDLGVTPDQSHQAMREAARTRHMLAREQRERKAEQETVSKPTNAGPDAEHVTIIGTRLQERQPDGKTIAEAHPVLKMLGARPEAALLQIIHNGLAAGEMDPKSDNNTLIQQAIAKVHSYFQTQHQVLAGIYGGATAPSTAQPTAPEIPNKEGQGQAARSITNASASVAPATPPAKAETTPQPKRYRTEEERRKAIVERLAKS